MCGIFGMVVTQSAGISRENLSTYTKELFLLSESRGKEAAGIAIGSQEEINVYKKAMPASEMVRTKEYQSLFKNLKESEGGALINDVTIIGHSRLVTNGIEAIQSNNQPVVKTNFVAVHNGIIVNDASIWAKYPLITRQYQVDTEIFPSLIGYFVESSLTLEDAYRKVFQEIEGTASLAMLSDNSDDLILATNNGSLYLISNPNCGWAFFASERHILTQFMTRFLYGKKSDAPIIHIHANEAYRINRKSAKITLFSLKGFTPNLERSSIKSSGILSRIIDYSDREDPAKAVLRRCTKCILPETMPFIEFDTNGVCSYCYSYEPVNPLGKDVLNKLVQPFRNKNGEADCFLAVSGGRDSCYGLHVLCKDFDLKPLTYTYDWGLLTDLARRNQARLCGKLGVEHIIVSADIRQKREYVRKNIEAWLKRPDLGMIPLFMAGDKQYFYYAKKVKDDNNLKISFLCENKLERAKFKSGFCGINEGKRRLFNLTLGEKTKMLGYYAGQYIRNPAYINHSMLDTMSAFKNSYLSKHDTHLQLFDYISWDEKVVVDTLINEYNWELATDTKSTWRIGDGTAAFYNYIYFTVAGFTENDALRSNQIREGVLDRDNALRLVANENQPRWDSLQWYSNTIGFNLNDALQIINKIPKLYHN